MIQPIMIKHRTVELLQALFKQHKIDHRYFEHEPIRTSIEAHNVRRGFTLSQGTKALLVKVKDKHEDAVYMLAVPGDKRFSSAKVRRLLGVNSLSFISEDEVRSVTGGIEPGGVPPFGNLFDIPLIADMRIYVNEHMIFNAGDRSVSLAIATNDHKKIAQPQIEDIAEI